MSRTFRPFVMAVIATVALAGAAAAQATPKAAKASHHAMASQSITGTLEKFDTSGNMLTVHTSKGNETMALGSDAKIQQGKRSLTAADLASHTGSTVRVTYTENNGQKMAQGVRVTGRSSAKTHASTSKKEGR